MTFRVLATFLMVAWFNLAVAAQTIPTLSSRPGAAYTLYLNFGGFNYSGSWFSDTPGITPAFDTNGNSGVFTATETTQMQTIWSRTAEKYSIFNVNVTTVDPAIAAGQSGTDALRKAYYDSQARMMHMVVGGNGSWFDPSGTTVGVSAFDVISTSQSNGMHTNWSFSGNYGSVLKGIAETNAHENGHAFGLEHQSLWSGSNLIEEYDPGDANRAPIMGNSDNAARGLWRRGTSRAGPTSLQNDIAVIRSNADIAGNGTGGYMDSGIGHTRATASNLPLSGTTIDSSSAKGLIAPLDANDPNPLGEANYTTDFFRITVTGQGANLNVTLRSGLSTLTLGTADPGAMLDATLRLLDADGNVIATSNTGTFDENITQNNLLAGTYYLQISSAGADSQYFDVGSYFLTGTLIPVPEPLTVLGSGVGLLAVGYFLRRRQA